MSYESQEGKYWLGWVVSKKERILQMGLWIGINLAAAAEEKEEERPLYMAAVCD
jgi:hypothetical protein